MEINLYIDIVSVFFFSMSGTLTAHKYKKLDVFGLGFVGFLTAVGGGTVRDLLLDAHPITWITHSGFMYAILLGYLAGLVFKDHMYKFTKPLLVIDALAVAIAAVSGLEKGLDYEASAISAILFGLISATVGGIIRDLLCNQVPLILRKETYASAIIIGSGFYFVAGGVVEDNTLIPEISAGVAIFALRIVSLRYGWNIEMTHFEKQMSRLGAEMKNMLRRNGKH